MAIQTAVEEFLKEWGIDKAITRGGLIPFDNQKEEQELNDHTERRKV